MDTDLERRALEVLEHIIDLPTNEQQQQVAVRCANDVELRRKVDELLLAHRQVTSDPQFLEPPPFDTKSTDTKKPDER